MEFIKRKIITKNDVVMHILIVALHGAKQPTGVCRHAINLARCLADLNTVSKITLVIGAWQTDYFQTALLLSHQSKKIELIDINIHNNSIARNVWFLLGLPNFVNQIRPTLVHLSFPLPFVRSRFSCPVVSTIHDLYAYEYPINFGYFRSIFNRAFLKQCIKESDGVTCVSQITLERLNKFFKPFTLQEKGEVIYNYVDFNKIYPKKAKIFDKITSTPFILSVAQHRKNKNLDLLIKAFAQLLEKKQIDDGTKLVIVGSSGPETQKIYQQISAYEFQDRVFLLSDIDDTELCWLYQNCQLFAIPSSIEGFCIPLIEALNFSCKVVCSDIPIFREVGNESCYFFDLTNDPVENLSRAISQSLRFPSSHQIFQELRFKKTQVAEQYLKFYATVLEPVYKVNL